MSGCAPPDADAARPHPRRRPAACVCKCQETLAHPCSCGRETVAWPDWLPRVPPFEAAAPKNLPGGHPCRFEGWKSRMRLVPFSIRCDQSDGWAHDWRLCPGSSSSRFRIEISAKGVSSSGRGRSPIVRVVREAKGAPAPGRGRCPGWRGSSCWDEGGRQHPNTWAHQGRIGSRIPVR